MSELEDISGFFIFYTFFYLVKGTAADTTDAPQP
jgi:hypothetical protein